MIHILWHFFLHQVALHIPGAYNLSMHLPVVIGTVPYRRLSPRVLRAGQIFTDSLMEYFGPQPQPAPPPYRESATPPPPIDSKSDKIQSEFAVSFSDRVNHIFISIFAKSMM